MKLLPKYKRLLEEKIELEDIASLLIQEDKDYFVSKIVEMLPSTKTTLSKITFENSKHVILLANCYEMIERLEKLLK